MHNTHRKNNSFKLLASIVAITASLSAAGHWKVSTFTEGGFPKGGFPTSITNNGTDLYLADAPTGIIHKIDSVGTPSVFAGSDTSAMEFAKRHRDGVGESALFEFPYDLTCDDKYLYVLQGSKSNGAIRKVTIPGAKVTTLSGTVSTLDGVSGIVKHYESLYVSGIKYYDSNRRDVVNKFTLKESENATQVDTFYTSDDGLDMLKLTAIKGTHTLFAIAKKKAKAEDMDDKNTNPYRILSLNTSVNSDKDAHFEIKDVNDKPLMFPSLEGITSIGNDLYVTAGTRIQKIIFDVDGKATVSSIAGNGVPGKVDGNGNDASFSSLFGITSMGNDLYVLDKGNNKVRKLVFRNSPPKIEPVSSSDFAIFGTLTATDIDDVKLAYSIPEQPLYGTVTLDALTQKYSYVPGDNFPGKDVFNYQVKDSYGNTATSTITVTHHTVHNYWYHWISGLFSKAKVTSTLSSAVSRFKSLFGY